jgi:NAD(P)-dependent dehydrogenase (short-subunit alcohol dehydrogenase family)
MAGGEQLSTSRGAVYFDSRSMAWALSADDRYRCPLRQCRTGRIVPLGSITEEYYDKTFDTNVKGLLFTVQKALPILSDGASIILTGSAAAARGTPSQPAGSEPCMA